jgi:hypothetical protein
MFEVLHGASVSSAWGDAPHREMAGAGSRPNTPSENEADPALSAHHVRVCDMCGRPTRRKRNLQDQSSARSGADMCAASNAAHTPRARMGVRGSGPIHAPRARGACRKAGFPDPVSVTVAPFLSFDLPAPQQPRRCNRLRGGTWSLISSTLGHQGPDDPGHLVGQGHPHQHRRLARQHAGHP